MKGAILFLGSSVVIFVILFAVLFFIRMIKRDISLSQITAGIGSYRSNWDDLPVDYRQLISSFEFSSIFYDTYEVVAYNPSAKNSMDVVMEIKNIKSGNVLFFYGDGHVGGGIKDSRKLSSDK
jgi:hypothetical protein